MPEAVLEKTEDPIIYLPFDLGDKRSSQSAVDCRTRLLGLVEQKRKIEDAEFRNSIGQIAARLIAKREQPMFHQPQNVLGAVAEVHDVPDIFDIDTVAEFGHETIADALQGEAEACRRRPIATHTYLDWISHLCSLG